MITISIDLLDFNNVPTFPLTKHHRGEGVAMIPATDVVDDGSASGWVSPGRVTLPTSAKRAAGGWSSPLFSWKKFWRWKTRFGWFCFFYCLCNENWVKSHFFCVAQGLWSFVISKTWLLCESSGHDNQEPLSIGKWDCWLLRC